MELSNPLLTIWPSCAFVTALSEDWICCCVGIGWETRYQSPPGSTSEYR
jgi:hypothetical protein